MSRGRTASAVLLLPLLAVAACHTASPPPARQWPVVSGATAPAANHTAACVDHVAPGVDYFPQKAAFRHSAQLAVSYHGTYKRLTFTPAVDTREVLEYVLVQCGAAPPEGVDEARVVRVPIRSLATANHSILSSVTRLGLVDRLVGISNRFSITEPTIRRLALERRIAEVGFGTHANIDATMAVHPDVHFTFYSAYPQSNLHPRLWELGVTALPMADHMEPTPLGRAEWLLFLALLTNQEADVLPYLAEVEAEYRRLAALTRNVAERPVVMTGHSESRDIWDLPGHRNHFATLLRDAGAEYFWDGGGSSSYVRASYERTLLRGSETVLWVGGPNRVSSRAELVSRDGRQAYLPPVRLGRVYALDEGGLEAWTYPYVDQSLDRPHVVLADLIRIIHPDISLAHRGVFTRYLE